MKDITITLENKKSELYPYGTRVNEIFSRNAIEGETPVVAALVNNELVSLSFKVEINADLKPVSLYDPLGIRIFRRTLSFILAMASKELFPERNLIIGHSLGDSYYYYFEGEKEVSSEDLDKLSGKMKEIIEADLPIERKVIAYSEALDYFKTENQQATALLLRYRNESKIPIYTCRDHTDLSYEPLLPSSGNASPFELRNYSPGFILRYPNSRTPGRLSPFRDMPTIFNVFKEYKAWGKILNVNCVGKLNLLSETREVKPFIQVAEALQDKKISQIADSIYGKRDTIRIILIAGPSSSGKTTFTKKLAIQLRVLGFNPVSISLDDYYLPNDKTPRDEDGNPDFEAIEALNIEQLNSHLLDLFDGKEVEIPIFDFKTGRPKETGRVLKMTKRNILLVEGIHGLNPKLTSHVPEEKKYKIYISALTQLNLDDHNRISTTDNRLIRRMVRDHQFRGNSAGDTLRMWPSVRKGENKNIFPFQNMADSAFNSALDYELAVLKIYAEPLLLTVKPSEEVYTEAIRLLFFLKNFSTIPPKYVPDQSILREFIGDSAFSY